MACAGVTLAVSGTVRAERDLDVRGTLGLDPEAPVEFRHIRLTFELLTDSGDPEVADLAATTEKYCVVLQNLRCPVSVGVTASATAAGPEPQSHAQSPAESQAQP